MRWKWQQPDWPNFSWNTARLRRAEEHFLIGTGVFTGTFKHLPAVDQEQLTIEAISMEAVTTSEIEDEILDWRCAVPAAEPGGCRWRCRTAVGSKIAHLMDKGTLRRIGERRHARYHIAIPMRKVSPVVLDEHWNFT